MPYLWKAMNNKCWVHDIRTFIVMPIHNRLKAFKRWKIRHQELPEYYDYYILLNYDIELNDAFERSIKGNKHPGCWQVEAISLRTYGKENGQHTQSVQHPHRLGRIWCYGLLLSVRNEGTIPPGLDHNLMADHANADDLSIDQLLLMSYVQCGWRRKGCSITLTNGFSGQTANSIDADVGFGHGF